MLSKRFGVPPKLGGKCVCLAALFLLGASATFPQEKLETPQATNDRIRQLAAAIRAKPGDYVIGGGDLLHIEVFDVPELSRDVRVGELGYISLPLIPVKVRAGGLTAFQLEEKLAELLQVNGLVSHPQVTVFVRDPRSQPITVIGAVKKPMVYQVLHQPTLLEVISEAGGISEDAGSTVIITRAGNQTAASDTGGSDGNGVAGVAPQTITVNLNDLLESGDPKFNILLMGGDVVSVPHAGIVYVVGAVNKPGGFVLQNDREQMTTLKMLALAGGLTGSARPRQAVILRNTLEASQRKEVAVDLTKVMARKAEDVRLLPSDILFVPDSAGRKALRRTGEALVGLTSGVALLRLSR